MANKGDIAEAICGAAICAKLGARSGGKITRINLTDVRKYLQAIQKTRIVGGTAQKTQIKVDVGGNAKDRITIHLNLKLDTMELLQDIQDFTPLNRLMESAVSFVNAPRISSLAEKAYTNNLNNKISVDVDGLTNNKTSKTDVKMVVDGLVFDKLSMKAGSKTLGQVGGYTWAKVRRVFGDGYNEITKKYETGLNLPINTIQFEKVYMKLLTEDPTYTTLAMAVMWAYRKAGRLFASGPENTKAKQVAEFIHQHATLNDPGIRIVKFHLGKYKVFNPLLLEQNLKAAGAIIKVVTRVEGKWPSFIVYDAAVGQIPCSPHSANVLFVIEPKADMRSLYITHVVEGGARLDELMDVTESDI